MRPGPASYPGGKNGAGVKQCIINQIPPHDVYIEPFGGGGAILFNKLPAQRNIVVEKTAAVAAGLCDGIRRRDLRAEVFNCCGLEYLKHFFHLYRIPAFASSLTPAGQIGRAHV